MNKNVIDSFFLVAGFAGFLFIGVFVGSLGGFLLGIGYVAFVWWIWRMTGSPEEGARQMREALHARGLYLEDELELDDEKRRREAQAKISEFAAQLQRIFDFNFKKAGLPELGPNLPPPDCPNPGDSDWKFGLRFLLAAPTEAVPDIFDEWEEIGGSLAVQGGEVDEADSYYECHIHTNHTDSVLNAAIGAGGAVSSIQISDLTAGDESLCRPIVYFPDPPCPHEDDTSFRYEIRLALFARPENIPEFRSRLEELGDLVLIEGDQWNYAVHIHSDTPALVFGAGMIAGRATMHGMRDLRGDDKGIAEDVNIAGDGGDGERSVSALVDLVADYPHSFLTDLDDVLDGITDFEEPVLMERGKDWSTPTPRELDAVAVGEILRRLLIEKGYEATVDAFEDRDWFFFRIVEDRRSLEQRQAREAREEQRRLAQEETHRRVSRAMAVSSLGDVATLVELVAFGSIGGTEGNLNRIRVELLNTCSRLGVDPPSKLSDAGVSCSWEDLAESLEFSRARLTDQERLSSMSYLPELTRYLETILVQLGSGIQPLGGAREIFHKLARFDGWDLWNRDLVRSLIFSPGGTSVEDATALEEIVRQILARFPATEDR